MIQKPPKTKTLFQKFQSGLKVVVVAEIACFLGSYGVWYRMNRDQDFRLYIHEKFPFLLEGFYKFGEVFDKKALERLRATDLAVYESKKGQ